MKKTITALAVTLSLASTYGATTISHDQEKQQPCLSYVVFIQNKKQYDAPNKNTTSTENELCHSDDFEKIINMLNANSAYDIVSMQEKPLIFDTKKHATVQSNMTIPSRPQQQSMLTLSIRKNYLYKVHLSLQPSNNSLSSHIAPWFINQYRSMKINQINYFDNPDIGLIALIHSPQKTSDKNQRTTS